MKRMMHILRVAAMLLMALPVASCNHPLSEDSPELSVSIHIPDMSATKAETGNVGATEGEKIFSSLQLWVFVSGGTSDGQLAGYKLFDASQLASTGLSHSTTTRFGMPLSREMFNTLSTNGARVDVYAVANVASATDSSLGEGTTRSELDAIVIDDDRFGADPLTMTVPENGLPMSGVLKSASVTGNYPILNVSTVTLTRAVSKIRFVFCQQGTPASGTNPAIPDKRACVVKSITFGGTSAECQIAKKEKLFTANKYGTTDNLFDIDGYTSLEATIAGTGNDPLIKNADISVCEHPDLLLFRSRGHVTETAQEYEDRLDETLKAWPNSQVGPIYIRETDKLISGTIVYNTGEEDLTATFSMKADDKNILSRNHSWILFAYFAEATKTLQFKIVVLPWDKEAYNYDFETQTVNVVRRFTIPEDTSKFTKEEDQNKNGYYNIYFWHTLNDQSNVIKGDIIIATPVGQKIHVVPVAGVPEGRTPIAGLFSVTPLVADIYPNGATTEHCKIEYTITCNPGAHQDAELEGNYIDLHFCVEIGNNERWIDLDSESIDYYRIILKKNWQPSGE